MSVWTPTLEGTTTLILGIELELEVVCFRLAAGPRQVVAVSESTPRAGESRARASLADAGRLPRESGLWKLQQQRGGKR